LERQPLHAIFCLENSRNSSLINTNNNCFFTYYLIFIHIIVEISRQFYRGGTRERNGGTEVAKGERGVGGGRGGEELGNFPQER
jgi:hypothetical protein